MNNYNILFILRLLKNIVNNFLHSFLVLYFLDISERNILPLGIYNLFAVLTIFGVVFFTRNITKSKNRIILLRLGIFLDLIYFLAIILLRENIINYIFLVGFLFGLSNGFYYSANNILESNGVNNKDRAKFTGSYTAVEAILSIFFPLIFGSLINATGFLKSLVIVIAIVIFRIFLSFLFKDNYIPESKKVDLKKYYQLTNNDIRFKQTYRVQFFNGIVISEAAFSYIITIYIIKVFSNSFSLGVFTSVFNVITFFIGIFFAKFLKKQNYFFAIKLTMTFTIISLFIMIFNCNSLTIILFNLFQTISKSLCVLIFMNNLHNLSNDDAIKKEYKSEYWLSTETSVAMGRVISSILFILLAFFDTTIMIVVYALFLIIFATNLIKLQKILYNSTNDDLKKV